MNDNDFLLDTDGDALIKNGDFAIGESNDTHIENILKGHKGHFFETPLLCVGILDEINGSTDKQKLKQNIRRQLTLDNNTVKSVVITDALDLEIEAKRKL